MNPNIFKSVDRTLDIFCPSEYMADLLNLSSKLEPLTLKQDTCTLFHVSWSTFNFNIGHLGIVPPYVTCLLLTALLGGGGVTTQLK